MASSYRPRRTCLAVPGSNPASWTGPAPCQTGAVMLGDEMIDEASRKMALVIAAKGRAAGLSRTSTFSPPDGA
jgi:hypothetical protein